MFGLNWQSLLDFVKDYPALFTAGAFIVFWTSRFLFGHKLVWFRCKLNLHKYHNWDMDKLDKQAELLSARLNESSVPTMSVDVTLASFCIDCARRNPKTIEETIVATRTDN